MERAAASRVELLVLSDHDTVSGFPEASEAARGAGVDLRCGIEINTVYRREGAGGAFPEDSVHVLGYGIKWRDPAFLERLAQFRSRRQLRVRRIVLNLQRQGVDLSFEEVAAGSGETLGRPHVADALRRRGLVASRQEAFSRYLTRGTPGYVESMGPSPEEAIALIRQAGGFASLAHPETLGEPGQIAAWARAGLEGLEAYYSSHTPSDILRYLELCERLGLLATGGSDFHGPGSGRDGALGVEVPESVFDRFMERLSLSRC